MTKQAPSGGHGLDKAGYQRRDAEGQNDELGGYAHRETCGADDLRILADQAGDGMSHEDRKSTQPLTWRHVAASGNFDGMNQITGGTGKFSGAKGKAPFKCKMLSTNGHVSCTQQFDYQLPWPPADLMRI